MVRSNVIGFWVGTRVDDGTLAAEWETTIERFNVNLRVKSR